MILYTPTPVKAGQLAGDVFSFFFPFSFLSTFLFGGFLFGIGGVYGDWSLTEGVWTADDS